MDRLRFRRGGARADAAACPPGHGSQVSTSEAPRSVHQTVSSVTGWGCRRSAPGVERRLGRVHVPRGGA
jgi:hypothetical protein